MIPSSAATGGERKRAVYLCELDWDLIVACLMDRARVTLWSAGAIRAKHIVDIIERRKVRGTGKERA